MKELDLGNSDFKSIIENNNYFVDKSLFIQEIIKAQKQVVLLPRPRRFGKTLNLSMLSYYFDKNQPQNRELFKNLAIWKEDNEIINKQGKYPVVYLSFKDAKSKTWTNTYKKIVSEIVKAYSTHDYLLESDVLKPHEKNIYLDIINKKAEENDYETSLSFLTEYLFRYHKEKAIVLIDEYDTPIQASYKLFYDDAISFMRNLLSGAFKDNKYLYKGVITGILRVSRESIFSGLNNVSVHSVLDNPFSDKFGFTEAEVKQIVEDFNVSEEFSQIKAWYNGYKFAETSDIYNPWSVLNYITDTKSGFKAFWANTSANELLKEQLSDKNDDEIRNKLVKLINYETIEAEVNENFIFPDLETNSELVWALLTFSGYLTSTAKTAINRYMLRIPNYEIRFIFQTIILNWLNTCIRVKQSLLIETANFLTNNEIEKFEKGFKQIIGDTFSYFDTQANPEYVYQSYVLGLLAIIGDDYIIKSNRESGEGRYDICLLPHDKTKYGIVIEIKQLSKDKKDNKESTNAKIKAKLEEAKSQIDKNKYYMELIENKISKIIKLPIVFVGKEAYITPANL